MCLKWAVGDRVRARANVVRTMLSVILGYARPSGLRLTMVPYIVRIRGGRLIGGPEFCRGFLWTILQGYHRLWSS